LNDQFSAVEISLPDSVIESAIEYVKTNYSDTLKMSFSYEQISIGDMEILPDHLKIYLHENGNFKSVSKYIEFCVNLLMCDSLDFFFSLENIITFDGDSDE
jgi:hypothetical protein